MRFLDSKHGAFQTDYYYYDHDLALCWYRTGPGQWLHMPWKEEWTEWYLSEDHVEWLPD